MSGAARSNDLVAAASAVITDEEGRLLLILRGTDPERGRWSVPGGSVEQGETFAEAAAREAFEETGLQVRVGRELWAVELPTADGRIFDLHDFAATVTGGELRPGDDADDARWFTPAELGRIPLTAELLEHLKVAGVVPGSE